jgi:hypothetical protein
MNEAFSGQQIIDNWAMDYEMELSNAARQDKKY